MDNRQSRLAWIALALLPLLGCGVRSETLAAMLGAADAVRRQNYNDFEKYVDVNALIGHAVDLTFSQISKQGQGFSGVLSGIAGLTKPYLVEQTRNEFRRIITNGEANKLAPGLKNLPSAQLMIGVATLFGVPESTDDYKIIDVKKSGAAENLKMNVRLGKNEPWLPLQVQSTKAGDHYRITRIENLDQIYTNLMNAVR